jgi:hypothetical protein
MNPSSPSQCRPGRQYQLNVVLHGLWALRTTATGIVASTTDEPDHVKKAGDWAVPEFNLELGAHHLRGVRSGSRRTFNDQENLVVRKAVKVLSPECRSYVINLPMAREIHSKRKFRTRGRTPMFEGSDIPALLPPEIAMLQVLVYDFDDPDQLTLHPLCWKPRLNEDGKTANLHLFAQPDKPVGDPEHFKHAYAQLARMFGLDIRPRRSGRAPLDKKTGIAGFPPQEERGLDERVAPGVSGSNCEMLVLDATGG